MPIYLSKEFETEVTGDGCGFICITQKNDKDKEALLALTRLARISGVVARSKPSQDPVLELE